MSLDNFQARYTSEDNSSFTEILDDENRKRKEKWAWAWEAQKKVQQQRDRMIEARERRLIEAPPVVGVREKLRIEVPAPAGLITDGTEAKGAGGAEDGKEKDEDEKENGTNKAVAIRKNDGEEESVVDVMAPQKDTRAAGVDGWEFKVYTHIQNLFSENEAYVLYTGSELSHVPARCRCRSLPVSNLQ
jgi:protein DGCR14